MMNFDIDKAVKMLKEKIETWLEIGVSGLPNFIVAVFVLTVFYIGAKYVKRGVLKVSSKITNNRSVNELMATLVYVLVILLGLFVSLGILNLDKTVTSLLAGAGVIGLALGFAAQEVAANFFSGVIIAFREPYKVGDIVEISGHKGTVKGVNLRTTTVTTFDGLEVFIPNRLIFSEPFINLTSTVERRIDLAVGVSYGDKLDSVRDLIKGALKELPNRISNKDIGVYFTDYGSSSVNLIVHIWIKYSKNTDYLETRHQAIVKIKDSFDQNDIMIPFPIRTIDFGIKGGVPIADSYTSEN